VWHWFKHFALTPLGLVASISTALFLAVEILALTVWGWFRKGLQAAKQYHAMLREPEDTGVSVPVLLTAVAIGVVILWAMNRNNQK
jgi:hypothetical protein